MIDQEELRTHLLYDGSNYCRTEVIASLFGVSVRRVQQLTQEGIIASTEVKVDKRNVRRYDLTDTLQKYFRYLSDKANGKSVSNERESELKNLKLEAEIALKESQGELHEIKTKIAAGKYISKEEAQMDYSRFFVVFKRFALSIPSRMSGKAATYIADPMAVRKLEQELHEEIIDMLRSFVVAGKSPSENDLKKRRSRKKKAEDSS